MGDRVEDPDAKAPAAPPRRKRYRTPKLERLGTLTEMTAAVGNTGGKNDHGSPGGPRKTS
jgi:hypothetical protein